MVLGIYTKCRNAKYSPNLDFTNSYLNNFLLTRFQGSKRKMFSWFYKNLKELEFNSVLNYIFIQYL
jgi:hypothetical protein